jgi:pantothenate kinase
MIRHLTRDIRDLHRTFERQESRFMLGLTGCCGSGKSTVAAQLRTTLQRELQVSAAVLALDGFHLPDARLDELGLRGRKGSPPTFDLPGFIGHVRRVRSAMDRDISVPVYSRELHEPISDANTISANTNVVIVEGNYLLLGKDGWQEVAATLDQVWFLDTPLDECMRRVRRRHLDGGCDDATADLKVTTNDRPNAELILSTQPCADRVIAV